MASAEWFDLFQVVYVGVAVQTGSVVYVGKHVPHRFVEIEEEMRVLVFIAPAETP